MRVDCPQCGEAVEVVPRHGLSGTLCPGCHALIATAPPRPSAPPAPFRATRDDGPSGCEHCGGPRVREARRCPQCGGPWLYRVLAHALEAEDRLERLVEYVARRQTRAEPRPRVVARLQRLPAVVLGDLTSSQARRVRQEVEAFGVHASIEADPAAAVPDDAGPRVSRPIVWLAALGASMLLSAGVYLFVVGSEFAPEPAPPLEAPAPVEPATPAPPAIPPTDVLQGLARPGSGGFAFFVDPDGWAVAPLHALDEAGGTDLRAGDAGVRAAVSRTDREHGLGLYHALVRAPYALSFGDATLLEPGARLFVVMSGAGAPRLVADAVVSPDYRFGRRVYLRLGLDPGVAADGAPVFNADGLVVGVYDHASSVRAAVPLAIHANALTEGTDALMAEILPRRPLSPRRQAWLETARAADRTAQPELYEFVERRLVSSLTCEADRCVGAVGLLTFEATPAALGAPLEARFLGPDQPPDAASPHFGRVDLAMPPSAWRTESVTTSTLGAALPAPVRAALATGRAEAHLHGADVEIACPASTRGRSFRVALRGAGGRQSEPIMGSAAGPAEPPVPAQTAPLRFGPFSGDEWHQRLTAQTRQVEALRARVDALRRTAAGEAPPNTRDLLEREVRQLAIIQDRLAVLLREADANAVPLQFRP